MKTKMLHACAVAAASCLGCAHPQNTECPTQALASDAEATRHMLVQMARMHVDAFTATALVEEELFHAQNAPTCGYDDLDLLCLRDRAGAADHARETLEAVSLARESAYRRFLDHPEVGDLSVCLSALVRAYFAWDFVQRLADTERCMIEVDAASEIHHINEQIDALEAERRELEDDGDMDEDALADIEDEIEELDQSLHDTPFADVDVCASEIEGQSDRRADALYGLLFEERPRAPAFEVLVQPFAPPCLTTASPFTSQSRHDGVDQIFDEARLLAQEVVELCRNVPLTAPNDAAQ